jgi:hypothetical protein
MPFSSMTIRGRRSRNSGSMYSSDNGTARGLTIGIDDVVGESKGPYFGACKGEDPTRF